MMRFSISRLRPLMFKSRIPKEKELKGQINSAFSLDKDAEFNESPRVTMSHPGPRVPGRAPVINTRVYTHPGAPIDIRDGWKDPIFIGNQSFIALMLPPTRSLIGEIKGHLISMFRDLTGGPLNAINLLSIVLFQTVLFAINILISEI